LNTTRITDNASTDTSPQINADGTVVWMGDDGSDSEIFLYDGSSTTQLTNNEYNDAAPQINGNGHVVWYGSDGSDTEVFLYDGSTTIQLTSNSYDEWGPQINNNGCVVWWGSNGSDYEIFLFDGLSTTQLTDNAFDDWYPRINDRGHVVWMGYDGSDYEIFLYKGSTTRQLTDNAYDEFHVEVNKNGYVVWQGFDGSDDEIFIWDGLNTTRITDNASTDTSPRINADGTVVWMSYTDSDEEIFHASPSLFIDRIGNKRCGPAEKISIVGTGFGNTQDASVIHFAKRTLDATSPRVKYWSDTKIRVRVPKYKCPWFKGAFRRVKVWVTVAGEDSNPKRIKVNRPAGCESCTENADCEPGQYCAKPLGSCETSGDCTPLAENCSMIWDPVCGCDGNTYSNSCTPALWGVNVAYEGECLP
jgi:hypothetical protein